VASFTVVTSDGLIGNLTNDSSWFLFLEENIIPFDFVPFKYLITLFATSMLPFDGLLEYLANILVIVDISGSVNIFNQFNMCKFVLSQLVVGLNGKITSDQD
jgi:hypothetical protein